MSLQSSDRDLGFIEALLTSLARILSGNNYRIKLIYTQPTLWGGSACFNVFILVVRVPLECHCYLVSWQKIPTFYTSIWMQWEGKILSIFNGPVGPTTRLPTDVINPNNMCFSIACTSQTLLWLSKKMRYFTTFFVAPLVIQLFVPCTLLVKSQ